VLVVRRLFIVGVLGGVGALAVAFARRLQLRRDEDAWTVHEAETPSAPAAAAEPVPEDAGTLEREGPHIGDDDLAAAITFPDDATLRDRVESQVLGAPDVPKGDMNIDAAAGVVTLRGTVDAALVDDLEQRVAAVEGVVRVENLLTAAEAEAG
jgi:hypothetical protein